MPRRAILESLVATGPHVTAEQLAEIEAAARAALRLMDPALLQRADRVPRRYGDLAHAARHRRCELHRRLGRAENAAHAQARERDASSNAQRRSN